MEVIHEFLLNQVSVINQFLSLDGKVPDAWRYYLSFILVMSSYVVVNRILSGFGFSKEGIHRLIIGYLSVLFIASPIISHLLNIDISGLEKHTMPEYHYPAFSMLWRFTLIGMPIYFMTMTIINWQREVRSHPFLAYLIVPVLLFTSLIWSILKPSGGEVGSGALMATTMKMVNGMHYARTLPKWYCSMANWVTKFVYSTIYFNLDTNDEESKKEFREILREDLAVYSRTIGRAKDGKEWDELLEKYESRFELKG